jgi:translation elongation factor EF-G
MASKLNCTPLLLQVPYFHTKEDFSVVDLVSMRVFTYRGEDSK